MAKKGDNLEKMFNELLNAGLIKKYKSYDEYCLKVHGHPDKHEEWKNSLEGGQKEKEDFEYAFEGKERQQNNEFHINTPYYGAWTKYGWQKDDWGLGLNKKRIDLLASNNKTVVVGYGKSSQQYTISAKKVQSFPIEKIKDTSLEVYIVPKSALNYRKKSVARCTKCGEEILGDEDSLCGNCSGEAPENNEDL